MNSFDIILGNFQKYEIECSERELFQELFENNTSMFVEEELKVYYKELITYIKKTEPNLSKDNSFEVNKSKVNVTELEKYAKDFEKNWKSNLKKINSDIMNYFQNFKTGNVILGKVLSQLLLYYSRYTEIVYLIYQNPPFRQSIVSNQSILYEMKNFSKNFE
jgi:vacuolar protein sorting-associated protein 52